MKNLKSFGTLVAVAWLVILLPMATAALNGLPKRSIHCPVVLEAMPYSVAFYPLEIRPLSEVSSFTFKRQHDATPPISILSFVIRPTAVSGKISQLVFNSVDRSAAGSWSHINKKLFRRLFPQLANLYPPRAVMEVARTPGVIAALHHSKPHFVERVSRGSMRGHALPPQTPARTGIADAQLVPDYVCA